MDPETRCAIPSTHKRIRKTQKKGRVLPSEEARATGRLGGLACVAKYSAEHMREIGRRGGLAKKLPRP